MITQYSNSCELIFSKQDLLDYAKVSGDYNPIHLSEEEAKGMGFRTCLVHGMLVMGQIGAIFRTFTNESVTIQNYEVRFQGPVYVEESYILRWNINGSGSVISFYLYSEGNSLAMKGQATFIIETGG